MAGEQLTAPTSTSRYELLVKIASGGMATVYVGRLRGALGFEQLVAVKRPHEHLLQEVSFRQSLLKEAQLASLIRHANVVSVRDIEVDASAILLVMDYVEGGSLQDLLRLATGSGDPSAAPPDQSWIPVGLRVVLDACAGIAAVHDLTDNDGRPMGMIHRDISPHNILVGLDGISRLTDFGIAKCLRADEHATQEGVVKGKLAYMAPEYMLGKGVDQRADIFAIGVVLWEVLTRRRLFKGENDMEVLGRILNAPIPLVSEYMPALGNRFDGVVAKALARNPQERFSTMHELIESLEYVTSGARFVGRHKDVGQFVNGAIGPELNQRREEVRNILRSGPRQERPSQPELFGMSPFAQAELSEIRMPPAAGAQIRKPPVVPGASAIVSLPNNMVPPQAPGMTGAAQIAPAQQQVLAAPQGYDASWVAANNAILQETGEAKEPEKPSWWSKLSLIKRIIIVLGAVIVLIGAFIVWAAQGSDATAPIPISEQQTITQGGVVSKRTVPGNAANDIAQLRAQAATDPDGVKRRLQARLLSGRATPEEIALLRTLCQQRPDQVCSDNQRSLRGL